ncbi:MAG: hypothetical protein FD153_444 [Rhodospirillaceae bacterium]|nr:MAG: hypothetical protein FD153_444 [Rhodospirillaceae bacterium]
MLTTDHHFGGSRDLPSVLWRSRAGTCFDFHEAQGPLEPLDDDPVAVMLGSDRVHKSRQLLSADSLFILTSGGL